MGTEIATLAQTYVGTPFHHQGRVPGVGLDCHGIFVAAARELGYEYDATDDYDEDPAGAWIEESLERTHDRVDVERAEPGDLLAFWITRREEVAHLGVLVGPGRFVHVERGKAVEVVELDQFWSRRLRSCWRPRRWRP